MQGKYNNSQLRYAIIYVAITLIALVFLNIFCSETSQNLFYRSKKTAMIEKCLLAAEDIAKLDVINPATVSEAVEKMANVFLMIW